MFNTFGGTPQGALYHQSAPRRRLRERGVIRIARIHQAIPGR
ncbi:hypothetical protein SELSPUOL_01062 [Selenomonas sputigena ATCC 35185]|uniref:Uncharacterized protein n=1 Tax=Selenomonas sputigena (strain ATCC 35185 / DSM 20758 / CCUG 44933 / VPI D19B-28) TaxID=546271 RepID=C9LTQ1_SELS3|nr:hypothetical protein SELSPUOL_01062 [Selenomonas sputigena ATCC 35185]